MQQKTSSLMEALQRLNSEFYSDSLCKCWSGAERPETHTGVSRLERKQEGRERGEKMQSGLLRQRKFLEQRWSLASAPRKLCATKDCYLLSMLTSNNVHSCHKGTPWQLILGQGNHGPRPGRARKASKETASNTKHGSRCPPTLL